MINKWLPDYLYFEGMFFKKNHITLDDNILI